MDSNNSISSCYLSEMAEKDRRLVRPGMRRDREGLGGVRPVCRRGPEVDSGIEGLGEAVGGRGGERGG